MINYQGRRNLASTYGWQGRTDTGFIFDAPQCKAVEDSIKDNRLLDLQARGYKVSKQELELAWKLAQRFLVKDRRFGAKRNPSAEELVEIIEMILDGKVEFTSTKVSLVG